MPDRIDYLDKLRRDLLEQFRGKPNIEVFQRALARQLADVYTFYAQLRTLRSLQAAEGAQLDGVGDIVCLSRADALVISKLVGLNVPMDDETYRQYLAFKIHLNTSSCTHTDIYNALKMFWKKPLYYSEDPQHPATMLFHTSTLTPADDVSVLFLAPKIKAAGVALRISAVTQNPELFAAVYIAQGMGLSAMTTTLPYVVPGTFDTHVAASTASLSVSRTKLPALPDIQRRAYLRDDATGAVYEIYISDDTYGIDPASLRTMQPVETPMKGETHG